MQPGLRNSILRTPNVLSAQYVWPGVPHVRYLSAAHIPRRILKWHNLQGADARQGVRQGVSNPWRADQKMVKAQVKEEGGISTN